MIERLFKLRESGTTVHTEVVAGATTFVTLSYIIFVQPAVLSAAGMDFGAVMVATCLSSAIGTVLMGLLANYPIALAPAMGHNFYFAFTVCGAVAAWGDLLQRGLATGTGGDGVHTEGVGTLDRFQRMPWMSGLPPCRLATGLPQTAWAWLGESIAGRGFAAVLAVLGALVFQGPDARFQRTNPGEQSLDEGQHRRFALLVGCPDLFRSRERDRGHCL